MSALALLKAASTGDLFTGTDGNPWNRNWTTQAGQAATEITVALSVLVNTLYLRELIPAPDPGLSLARRLRMLLPTDDDAVAVVEVVRAAGWRPPAQPG